MNLDVQKAIENIGDEQTLHELLEMVVDMLAEEIPKVQAALESQDLIKVRSLVHRLNGSLGLFATPNLTKISRDLELNAAEQNKAAVETGFPMLKQELSVFSTDVKAYLQH